MRLLTKIIAVCLVLVAAAGSAADARQITDFSEYLNVSPKGGIGDSLFGWSMDKSSDIMVYYRSFDGKETELLAQRSGASILISVRDNDDGERVEGVFEKEKLSAREYSLVSQTMGETPFGAGFSETILTYRNEFLISREYITEDYLYSVLCYTPADLSAAGRERLFALIRSFDAVFPTGADAEDLNDLDKFGCREYASKAHGISLKLPDGWVPYSNRYSNVVQFRDQTNASDIGEFRLEIYSRAGRSIQAMAEEYFNRQSIMTSRALSYYRKTPRLLIDGKYETAGYDSYINSRSDILRIRTLFFVCGEYDYKLTLLLSLKKTMHTGLCDFIVDSIRLSELDAAKFGEFSQNLPLDDGVTKTYTDREGRFSYDAPYSLREASFRAYAGGEGVAAARQLSHADMDLSVSLSFREPPDFGAEDGYAAESNDYRDEIDAPSKSLDERARQLIEEERDGIRSGEKYTLIAFEDVEIDGRAMLYLSYKARDEAGAPITKKYFFIEDGQTYILTAIVGERNDGDLAAALCDGIMASLKTRVAPPKEEAEEYDVLPAPPKTDAALQGDD